MKDRALEIESKLRSLDVPEPMLLGYDIPGDKDGAEQIISRRYESNKQNRGIRGFGDKRPDELAQNEMYVLIEIIVRIEPQRREYVWMPFDEAENADIADLQTIVDRMLDKMYTDDDSIPIENRSTAGDVQR